MTEQTSTAGMRNELLVTRLLEVLRDSAEPLRSRDAIAEVEQRAPFTDEERLKHASGDSRAKVLLEQFVTFARAAGWIDKTAHGWLITDAGRAALQHPPADGLYTSASRIYRTDLARRQSASPSNRATSVLEQAADYVEASSWTAYSDLAQLAGLANGAVRTWVGRSDHPAAHRILGADGKVADDFRWADPGREDDPRAVLEQEGIVFDGEGHASEAQRIPVEALRELVGAEAGPGRAWLVRGSSVLGKNMVPEWTRHGSCSLSASRLRHLTLPVTRAQIAEAVEQDYADRSYNIRTEKISEIDLFLNRMTEGDLVATTSDGQFILGWVAGPPSMVRSSDERSNLRRPVDWVTADSPLDFADLPPGIGSRLRNQRDVLDLSSDYESLVRIMRAARPNDTPAVADDIETGAPSATPAELPEPSPSLADKLHCEPAFLDRLTGLLRDRKQIILYGPPGTGKTYIALALAHDLTDDNAVKLVQFHPSYTYEDFFEGFRPVVGQAAGMAGDPGVPAAVSFSLHPGPLRKIVDAATENPSTAYILIIDEINRANLAKVFGELYFLLEYRDENVELLYSTDSNGFTMPPNVYLIGTMNTTDRSIALVDAAMRRRFAFVHLHPDTEPIRGLLRRWLTARGLDAGLADLQDALNSLIDDADFKIGPSYFMRPEVHRDGGVEVMWETSILPLLQEHHFGDGTDVTDRYALHKLLRRIRDAGRDEREDAVQEP